MSLFYEANEFRFVDDGKAVFVGLTRWVREICSSHWPSVKLCTIQSKHADIVAHMRDEFRGFASAEFDGDAPHNGKKKLLKLTLRNLSTPAEEARTTKHSEAESHTDGESEDE